MYSPHCSPLSFPSFTLLCSHIRLQRQYLPSRRLDTPPPGFTPHCSTTAQSHWRASVLCGCLDHTKCAGRGVSLKLSGMLKHWFRLRGQCETMRSPWRGGCTSALLTCYAHFVLKLVLSWDTGTHNFYSVSFSFTFSSFPRGFLDFVLANITMHFFSVQGCLYTRGLMQEIRGLDQSIFKAQSKSIHQTQHSTCSSELHHERNAAWR